MRIQRFKINNNNNNNNMDSNANEHIVNKRDKK